MEILEAYKAIPPSGTLARIYEFRGRRYYPLATTAEAGQEVKTVKRGKLRSVYVAAENLFDAINHLCLSRPEFVPKNVSCLGTMRIKNGIKPINESPVSKETVGNIA
jgi:hypothetical protein